MLRVLLYGLTILHLGPGLAFALLAFGCDGATPYLGAICAKSVFSSFALLTAAGWLILSLGLAAVHLVRLARSSVPHRTGLRVWALLAVLALGAMFGASGAWLTGSQLWFVAIPTALATGWLFLANPLECQPPHQSGGSTESAGQDSAA
jgi:hypothetical protein